MVTVLGQTWDHPNQLHTEKKNNNMSIVYNIDELSEKSSKRKEITAQNGKEESALSS